MHPELDAIRLHTRRTRLLPHHGEHDSLLKGRGMAFDELREYVDGDSLRSINWRATARNRTPVVNRFYPTQQMHVHLVLALSGSMLFGQPSKQTIAIQLLTALSYAAHLQRDRLRVTLFDDDVRWELRPTRQAGAMDAIYDAASSIDLHRRRIDYEALEHYLMATAKHPSGMFILGDFLTIPSLEALASRHDLHVITIRSPEEEQLSLRGVQRLFDPVMGEVSRLTIGHRTAEKYAQRMKEHDTALENYCHTHRIDRIIIHTNDDPIAVLAEHLRRQA